MFETGYNVTAFEGVLIFFCGWGNGSHFRRYLISPVTDRYRHEWGMSHRKGSSWLMWTLAEVDTLDKRTEELLALGFVFSDDRRGDICPLMCLSVCLFVFLSVYFQPQGLAVWLARFQSNRPVFVFGPILGWGFASIIFQIEVEQRDLQFFLTRWQARF